MRAVLALALWLAAVPAAAVLPDEMLADPVLEARARDISKDLRCVVCQNQSIDDSDAPLAHDLRVIVREQLGKGRTNQQVIDYVVARYGHFVLLKPPVETATWALWLGPFAILGLGGIGLAVMARRRRPSDGAVDVAPLDAGEAAALSALVDVPAPQTGPGGPR